MELEAPPLELPEPPDDDPLPLFPELDPPVEVEPLEDAPLLEPPPDDDPGLAALDAGAEEVRLDGEAEPPPQPANNPNMAKQLSAAAR